MHTVMFESIITFFKPSNCNSRTRRRPSNDIRGQERFYCKGLFPIRALAGLFFVCVLFFFASSASWHEEVKNKQRINPLMLLMEAGLNQCCLGLKPTRAILLCP